MSAADNLAFHVQDPTGGQGYVLLLFRPEADGNVRYREWSSADYTAPGREEVAPVEQVRARITEWARTGWTFTESPIRLEHWLAGR